MIRFFVSSTFDDMIAERELLHKKIVPKLNEYAKTLGETVEICDLRWGIDTTNLTEEEKLYKIIDICLGVINDCDGCVIAFLGNRYGTIPENKEKIEEECKKYNIELPSYEISITQLELEYGVLASKDCSALCYFRRLNNDHLVETEGNEKLEDLKKRLKGLENGAQCREYRVNWDARNGVACGLEEIEINLMTDLKAVIEKKVQNKKAKNWIEEELLVSKSICERNMLQKAGKRKFKENIINEISGDNHTIYIYGESGSGKSTIMANLYEQLKEENGVHDKYYIACGHGSRSKTYLDILTQIVFLLNGNEVKNYSSIKKAEEDLVLELKKYEDKFENRICIFIDAMEKISAMPSAGRLLDILENSSLNKICFVISGISENSVNVDRIKVHKMKPLTEEDIIEIFKSNMERSGPIVEDIISQIINKSGSESPLYLMTVINILKMNLSKVRGKRDNEIFNEFKKIISMLPENIYDLYYHYLCMAGEEYLHSRDYKSYLEFIVAAEKGINIKDIANLVKNWNELDFYYYFEYLGDSFRRLPDGRIVFSHDIMTESVKRGIGPDLGKIQDSVLYPYLKSKNEIDAIHISDGLYLSARNKDYEYAEELFGKIKEEMEKNPNKEFLNNLITELMTNLRGIGQKNDCQRWFRDFVKMYPLISGYVLYYGIRYDSMDSYARIIPAKDLSDEYLCELLRIEKCEGGKNGYIQNGLKKLCQKMDERERFDFCVFLAEYIGAYEVISRVEDSFAYEYIVFDFFCNQIVFENLINDKKMLMFKMINYVFYSNNKVLKNMSKEKEEWKQAEIISKQIIKWYKDNIQDKSFTFGEMQRIESLFLSNIGQYYNALKRYEDCLPYRVKALQFKIDGLNQKLLCGNSKQFLSIFQSQINLDSIMDESFNYIAWKDITDLFKREFASISDDDVKKAIAKDWNAIAISYRTLATDCYYISKKMDNTQEERNTMKKSVGFHKLCLFLQTSTICEYTEIEKEIVVTIIRLLGSLVRLYSILENISLEQSISLRELTEDAFSKFSRYAKYDMTELKNFKDNLQDALGLPLDIEEKRKIEIIRKQLSRYE